MADGEKRTAGEAWDNGVGYKYYNIFNAKMDGNDWATLCPAPMKENPVWPQSSPGNRKGTGCIIFDTYMNYLYWNDVIDKISGRNTYEHDWIKNNNGAFGFKFKFGETGGNTSMRANWEKCRNHDYDQYQGRNLDGDRVAPTKDHKDWTF